MIKNFLNSDVIWMDSVDSTNEEIKRRIHEFTKSTWIIANKQTKGKGRNGNSWVSDPGNFFGSVILYPVVEQTRLHIYGFFVGVALYNTIKKIVREGVDIRLKWPNDIMIEDCKVAGILLETVKDLQFFKSGLIVGVGVNLNSSPSFRSNSKKRYETQCLANFADSKINQVSFFKLFNDELIRLESSIHEENLCSILSLWQARSYDKGAKIQIYDSKGGVNTGIFLGLDEIGGLIVGEASGVKKIYSGDVYFGS